MAYAWIGTCKTCGEESIVRYANSIDESSGGRVVVEIPNPNRQSEVMCKNCGAKNTFYDNELKHRDVNRQD
jgi:transcription elongation factor Elf1